MKGVIQVECRCPLCNQRFSMSWTNEPCESTKNNPLSDDEFLIGQMQRNYRCPNCGDENLLTNFNSSFHAQRDETEGAWSLRTAPAIDTMEKFEQLRKGDFDDFPL